MKTATRATDVKTCAFCKGSGRCATCDGRGGWTVRKGWLMKEVTVLCRACEGRKACQLCHGSGTPARPPTRSSPF